MNLPTRIEWGKNLHDLRPFYAERMRLGRVGPLPTPEDPKGLTEYHFDASDRLVEARTHRGRGRVDVQRYRHGVDEVEVEHLSGTPGVPVTRARFELEAGRVKRWRWQSVAGTVEEVYRYEGARLVEVRSTGPNDPSRIQCLRWGASGLVAVTEGLEGSAEVVEVYRAESVGFDEALAGVEDRLFAAIVARVRELAVDEPAYALLLVENDGYDAVPPELAVGLVSERERWSREGDRARLWSPEDLTSFGGPLSHLDDESLIAAVRTLQRALRAAGDAEPAHALNLRVAKRLNEELARLALPKTDDFAVVVVGLEGGLREADLERHVPAAQLATLRARGWV